MVPGSPSHPKCVHQTHSAGRFAGLEDRGARDQRLMQVVVVVGALERVADGWLAWGFWGDMRVKTIHHFDWQPT